MGPRDTETDPMERSGLQRSSEKGQLLISEKNFAASSSKHTPPVVEKLQLQLLRAQVSDIHVVRSNYVGPFCRRSHHFSGTSTIEFFKCNGKIQFHFVIGSNCAKLLLKLARMYNNNGDLLVPLYCNLEHLIIDIAIVPSMSR